MLVSPLDELDLATDAVRLPIFMPKENRPHSYPDPFGNLDLGLFIHIDSFRQQDTEAAVRHINGLSSNLTVLPNHRTGKIDLASGEPPF
ncbi:MAG: hypothetical protein AUF79_07000 [Crenarchaeota archaeon 13_1_20CM_2_51_8]|nr:MAG: hypothetical protein AUF79_07000 [Crenarchaeota archaeon 13_1_20CM_2_51_8]